MGRSPKYVDEVEKLLRNGWNVKDIVSNTNISKSTVYDVLAKMKKRARYNFKELMSEDYLWKYENTLDNFDRTIRECNEEMELVKNKYAIIESKINLQIVGLDNKQAMVKAHLLANLISCQSSRTNEIIKLCAQRDKASDLKARVYNAGPVVNAIDEWVNRTTPPAGELPRIQELDKVDPQPLNPPENRDELYLPKDLENKPNINVEDEKILPSRLNNEEDIKTPSDEDLKTLREMKEDEEKK